MSIWNRFTNWWWGIPGNPIEQDEFGNTMFGLLDSPAYTKVWLVFRPAFTSMWKFVAGLAGLVFAAVIAWAVFVLLKSITGLG